LLTSNGAMQFWLTTG